MTDRKLNNDEAEKEWLAYTQKPIVNGLMNGAQALALAGMRPVYVRKTTWRETGKAMRILPTFEPEILEDWPTRTGITWRWELPKDDFFVHLDIPEERWEVVSEEQLAAEQEAIRAKHYGAQHETH